MKMQVSSVLIELDGERYFYLHSSRTQNQWRISFVWIARRKKKHSQCVEQLFMVMCWMKLHFSTSA